MRVGGWLRVAVTGLLVAAAGPGCASAQGGLIRSDAGVAAKTPAARQQRVDRAFLFRRGIGPARAGAAAGTQQQSVGELRERMRTARVVAAAMARRAHARAAAVQPQVGSAARLSSGDRPSAGFAPSVSSPASTTTWQAFGPVQVSTAAYGLVTGRISALAADPNDPSGNTLYVGATGGGVWKSTNAAGSAGSVTFTPLTDDIAAFANSVQSVPSLSIGAVSVEPGNPNVILAGTGDPNDALDSYYGVGLLRSSDGGQSWTLIGQSRDASRGGTNYSMKGLGFAGFAWSTKTQDLVVAAVSQSLEGLLVNPGFEGSSETGLYYSTDAGQTWYLSTITDGTNELIQSSDPPTAPPGNPATAVVWNAVRQVFIAAVRFHGYYSSPDGVTWTRLAQQPGAQLTAAQCPTNTRSVGSTSCPIYRGVLAVQPVTGDTFALTTDLNNVDQGLYQDVCSTSGLAVSACSSGSITWGTELVDTALDAADGTIPQGDYNLSLAAVSSQQDTILFAGTEDVYRCSLANSCTWRNTTNDQTCAAAGVAPSTHAIEGLYGANGLLYFGNDGGLWRTTDTVSQTGAVCATTDATHYQNLNAGLGSLAEVSHLAVSPASGSNGELVLASVAGAGVAASESAAAQSATGAWQQLLTGEGSYVAIDPQTPTNWYADNGPGVSIYSCATGSTCNAAGFGAEAVIDRDQVEDDADYFLDPAPWMLDPANPGNLLVGTCRMWRGPVAGGWSSSNLLSAILDGSVGSVCDGNAELRAIGAGGSYNSTQGGEQMYAGMAGPLDGGGAVPGHLYGATVPQVAGTVSWVDLWRNPVTNRSMTTQFNEEGYAISSIAMDPHDGTGETVYVSIAGFPGGQDGIVYGTTDGGAHWQNLTNSLPFAPVNRVLVDPNNSNYVYVAGDFGVYYTTNVTNCVLTTTTCWSQMGAGLPNAPVTDLGVYSTGTSTVLEAATYGRGIWMLGLTTTPVTAQAALSPASYSFAAQAVGTPSSSVGSFLLQSTGTAALAIAQISVTPQTPGGDYAQTNTCGGSVAAGNSCTIRVSFTPAATGSRPGTLTVSTNGQTPVLTAALSGTGLAPGAISMSPASLSFATTAAGSSAAAESVTVTDTGGVAVTLGAQTIAGTNTGDFGVGTGGTCGSSLAAGSSCVIPVVFHPLQAGTRTALLQLVAGATGSPFTVSLSGIGVAPVTLALSPSSLSFAGTSVGTMSSAQTLTVTNGGGVAAQLGTAAVSGDYGIATNSCGTTLAANSSCQVGIVFAPTATGSRAGLFTLPSSSIPAGQVTASLSGNGLQAASFALAPTSLNFGSEQQGVVSTVQTIVVTNNGGSAAQNPVASASGDFAIATSSCGATLAVGANCSVGVTFTPTAPGVRNGSFTFVGGGASATASLSGTGTAPPALAPNPASVPFPVTAEGSSSASEQVSVTNTGGNAAQIAAPTVSGAFALTGTSCPVAPLTLAIGGTCAFEVDFSPAAAAAYTGTLTITGNFSTVAVPLNGTGTTPAAATVTPTSLSFAATVQGTVSAAQTLTIESTGGLAVTLGTPSVTAEFQISANSCPASLAPGASCSVSILFHPADTGARSGTFTQPGSMAGGALTAALSGTGLAPGVLTLVPGSLQYGSLVVGQTSAAQQVTVSNSGGSSVAVGTPVVSGDYAVTSNACGAELAAGQSCAIAVVFHPTAAGDRPGQLTVPGDGSAAAVVVTLDGAATTPGQLTGTPSSLAFGTVATGSSGVATATVTNTGGTAVQVSLVQASGDFSVTGGTCTAGTLLAAAGGNCSVTITFVPAATGLRSGVLTIDSDATPAKLTIGLAGEGAVPGSVVLSPDSAVFGTVVLGAAAVTQTFTATNPGGVAVSLGVPTVSGAGYRIATDQCGTSLGAGASCTMEVEYDPTTEGTSSGSLLVPGSFAASPATATLAGSAVTPGALSLSPSPLSFGTVVVGTSVTDAVAIVNTGGAAVTLGSPVVSNGYTVQSGCPVSLAPGATCTVQVTFAPSVASALSGLLTVPGSISGGAVTDALEGTGVAPGSLVASPIAVSYAATVKGGVSAAQTITFRNPGGVSVGIAPAQTSSADYTLTSNGCGASLPAGASCSVAVAFTPVTAGDRPGTVTLAASAANGPSASATLDGVGEAPAALGFSPTSLSFGSEAVRTTTAAQSLGLSNTGGVSTSLGLPVLTGPYAITANSCGASLAAGASCQISVQFAPVADGTAPGSLSIAGSGGSPQASAGLSGGGLALIVSPTAVNFPTPLPIGTTSTPIAIGVENLGTTAIAIGSPVVTGDFAIDISSCGSSIAANTSCLVEVTFTPTAGGLRTGTFTVTDGSETGVTQLSGTGLSPATDALSPGQLVFGSTVVGQVSGPQALTLTNSGDATLTQISVVVTGPFEAANNCGTSLGGHLSCTIAVTFAPNAVGAATGTITVADVEGLQRVVLLGQGAAPPQAFASPGSINFGPYAQGVATPAQTVTVSNQGSTAIAGMTFVTGTADFRVGANSCGAELAAGGSCTVAILFTPQAIGNREDTLTVASPNLTAPLVVGLAGSGEDYQIAVVGTGTDVLTSGQVATYQFVVTPVGNSTGSLAIACAGAPANAVCTVNPPNLSVAGGAAGSFSVSVATAVTAVYAPPAGLPPGLTGMGGKWWLAGTALALLCPWLVPRARRLRSLVALVGLVALALLGGGLGCGIHASGAGGGTSSTPPGGTPSGSYSLVVTASFPGAQRTAIVQLVVQ